MKTTFKIELSGVVFKINSQFEYAKEFCKDFLTQKCEDYEISTTLEGIKEEQTNYTEKYPPELVETTCIYRHIAELLPLENRIVMHGVALKYKDNGYLFVAPSGIGKTTHANLWKKYLGEEVQIINGDKPILEFTSNGIILHSNPWCGKEGVYTKTTAKLNAICLIGRGKICSIEKADFLFNLDKMLNQIYMPQNQSSLDKTIEYINNLSEVDTYQLKCDISKHAFVLSYKKLTGENYEN